MGNKTIRTQAKDKGIFRKLGEAIGKVGHDLQEGKETVVSASHNIVDKITSKAQTIFSKSGISVTREASGSGSHKAGRSSIEIIRRVCRKDAERIGNKMPQER